MCLQCDLYDPAENVSQGTKLDRGAQEEMNKLLESQPGGGMRDVDEELAAMESEIVQQQMAEAPTPPQARPAFNYYTSRVATLSISSFPSFPLLCSEEYSCEEFREIASDMCFS
jgi:hypothetical protein